VRVRSGALSFGIVRSCLDKCKGQGGYRGKMGRIDPVEGVWGGYEST
jgi:hypothetical protein